MSDTFVNIKGTRAYMEKNVEPIMTDLVAQLALERPDNVLAFIRDYCVDQLEGDTTAKEETAEEIPICCFSGFEAELKVQLPDGQVAYYTEDAFYALKRKGKLRGCLHVPIGESFPSPEELEKHPADVEWTPLGGNAPSRDEIDNRPVTPPSRDGFKMTAPGQNFHEGGSTGKALNEPGKYVSFEPQALGQVNEEERNEETPEQVRERRIKAAEQRQDEAKTNNLGMDHLVSEEKKQDMYMRRRRDELMGKISAHYQSMGGSAPFGLGAANVEALEKHLSKCKRASVEYTQVQENNSENVQKENVIAKRILGGKQKDIPASSSGEARYFSFEPKAFGQSQDDGGDEYKAPETLEEKRERAALAASRRFG